MKTSNSFPQTTNQASRPVLRNSKIINAIQTVSRIVTLIFLAGLVWVIYQAFVTGNPLPAWAWLGLVVFLAVAVGLGVAVIVYRGISEQTGPFDFGSSVHVTGELKREAKRVELNGADSLQANIEMAQGVLLVTGGADFAMKADLTYDDADWKPPVVEYSVDGGQGKLQMAQKATGRPAMRQGRSEWEVRLNGDLSTDLRVKFGAGKADLKLGGMVLSRLWVESGVGELDLDLSGEFNRSLEATIKAGVGDTTVWIPSNVGVRIQTAVSFGKLEQHGLVWNGEAYTNALYGQTAITLDIALTSGMGKVDIRSDGKHPD